nr:hypothetical protein [Pseudomonas sp. BIGb0427]
MWFIARVQRFEDGSRIKTEALKAALTEKFGKPSNITQMMSLGLVWQYDRDGKQYFGPSSEGPCKGVRSASSNIPGVSFPAPQSFSPTCGENHPGWRFGTTRRNGASLHSVHHRRQIDV